MYITREEAVGVLHRASGSGILDDDLEDMLEEVATCISAEEEMGIFLWGADDDAIDLFVMKRSDLITDEWIKHQQELYERYKIREINENED